MAKDLEILAAPSVDPQIWKHELQHTDGQGGGQLSITNLSAGIKFKKGALINFDFTTKEVNPVKNALVVAGGTTSAPRVTKKHLFKVGDFVYVSGDAVTINAINTSNSAYDVLTLSAACTGATAGAYLEQASAAGASPSPKFLANAINGESKYDVRGGERITPVLWIFQLIKKSALPYEASPARLADLSGFKFA